jgi:hypothetical protein
MAGSRQKKKGAANSGRPQSAKLLTCCVQKASKPVLSSTDYDHCPPHNHAASGPDSNTSSSENTDSCAKRDGAVYRRANRCLRWFARSVASSIWSCVGVRGVWLTPWAALDRLWLATDPPRCRGLIIAMALPECRRRYPSGTVRVALPQRARSRPHPPTPQYEVGTNFFGNRSGSVRRSGEQP